MISIIEGDCREVLKDFRNNHFDVACFSPPYGVGLKEGFDVRWAFDLGGRFIPYAREIARTCKIWAINLAPLTEESVLSLYIERFILDMASEGVELYDRWITVKSSVRPRRGERALSGFEYVLVFLGKTFPRASVKRQSQPSHRTTISVGRHKVYRGGAATNLQPYPEEIPRQMLEMYAPPGGLVLDPFCGSGTTLRVAASLGLNAVGIELDPGLALALKEEFS